MRLYVGAMIAVSAAGRVSAGCMAHVAESREAALAEAHRCIIEDCPVEQGYHSHQVDVSEVNQGLIDAVTTKPRFLDDDTIAREGCMDCGYFDIVCTNPEECR